VQNEVDTIVAMMLSGQWRPGDSHMRLRDLWGLNMNVVQDRARVASKVVRHLLSLSDEEREDAKTRYLALLEDTVHKARDAGEFGAAVSGIKALAELAGLVEHRSVLRVDIKALMPHQVEERILQLVDKHLDYFEATCARLRQMRAKPPELLTEGHAVQDSDVSE
jgi:hypothetical protein